jgi:hypothetical protein
LLYINSIRIAAIAICSDAFYANSRAEPTLGERGTGKRGVALAIMGAGVTGGRQAQGLTHAVARGQQKVLTKISLSRCVAAIAAAQEEGRDPPGGRT